MVDVRAIAHGKHFTTLAIKKLHLADLADLLLTFPLLALFDLFQVLKELLLDFLSSFAVELGLLFSALAEFLLLSLTFNHLQNLILLSLELSFTL